MGGILDAIVAPIAHPIRTGHAVNNQVAAGAHWLFPHSPLQHFGANSSSLGHDLVSGFDPRSRAGLANIASIFAGGPKGDATPAMEDLGMRGQFAPYGSETGTALDRGLANEGPIRPGKGYNPSMQKMVERAHTNPFIRASKDVTSKAEQDMLEKQSALEMARQKNAAGLAMRKQVDQHLGAEPMAIRYGHGERGDYPASAIHGPSLINHPSFLKGLLQRRYQAQLGHNHMN